MNKYEYLIIHWDNVQQTILGSYFNHFRLHYDFIIAWFQTVKV